MLLIPFHLYRDPFSRQERHTYPDIFFHKLQSSQQRNSWPIELQAFLK
ncbi:MAG: CRISPR-associated protein Cas5 [Flavobacterium sp.]|nr:MAG: CRISPR-associated protein Cas5 [Flavobacterium sp.]